jgi:hypothetical protein
MSWQASMRWDIGPVLRAIGVPEHGLKARQAASR